MWALHGPDFGWDPPRGKYILSWVIFPLTFLLHRFWRCAHHFGSQNDQELVPIQKADAGDKKEGGPSVWARNSCKDIEGGIVSDVWIAINVCIYTYIHIHISCIILFSFRSHKYVIPFSEGTFDKVFPIWRHPGPSLQVTEVAAAKADEDLQAWLPWFSAESRIYMNLRKSLGVNKRILKYLWYSKKHSDVTDVLVKSCLVDIELLV